MNEKSPHNKRLCDFPFTLHITLPLVVIENTSPSVQYAHIDLHDSFIFLATAGQSSQALFNLDCHMRWLSSTVVLPNVIFI